MQRLLQGGNRGVRTTILVVVALAVLAILWGVISYYWTDYLWYQEMGHTNIFWTPFLGRLFVGLFFAVIFFAVFYGSVWTARRLSPKFRPVEADKSGTVLEMLSRRRWSGKVLLAASLFVALIVGLSYGGRWREVMLFLNRQTFGYTDPLFGKDASFFVYTLPILSMFVSFVSVTMILTLIFTSLTYLADRAFSLSPRNRVVLAPHVKAHLSVLAAVLMLAWAANFALQRWELVYSQRGSVFGANYTDVHTMLPVLSMLAIVALVAAALFLVNLFFRGWKVPAMAIGLILLFWVFAGKSGPLRGAAVPGEAQRDHQRQRIHCR